jgi:flagellin-like hook-associated protein FlgL
MSVVINTNSAASVAANNLAYSNEQLQKSLNKLSSGSKIVNPSDDAGGLAVSMKLTATANRESDLQTNLSDATSYAQTQDGALQVAGSILDRISQLYTLDQDPTKNSSDLANYNDEFTQLQGELNSLGSQAFNGVSLFGTNNMTVAATDDLGSAGAVTVAQQNLLGSTSSEAFSPFTDNFANLNNWTDQSFGSGSPSISDPSGTYLSLNTTGDDFAVAQSKQSFSGAFDMTFTAKSGGGSPLALLVEIGNSEIGDFNGLTGTAETIRIVADGNGNATAYVNGSESNTYSGVSSSGKISLLNQNIGASSIQVSGLSMTSTASTSSNVDAVATAASLGSLSLSTITSAIQDVATMRANNGAEQSRLGFASTMLTTNETNLQSAISNITDVDVAKETTNLAKWNVLVQAGTSMLTQANQAAQTALKLITG